MIKSLNSSIDDEKMELFIQELEERDEMICFAKACVGNLEVCVGQACAGACIGITICAAGAHIGA